MLAVRGCSCRRWSASASCARSLPPVIFTPPPPVLSPTNRSQHGAGRDLPSLPNYGASGTRGNAIHSGRHPAAGAAMIGTTWAWPAEVHLCRTAVNGRLAQALHLLVEMNSFNTLASCRLCARSHSLLLRAAHICTHPLAVCSVLLVTPPSATLHDPQSH